MDSDEKSLRLTGAVALFLISCAGKSHVDVDILGDVTASSTTTSGQGGATAGAAGSPAGSAGRTAGQGGAGGSRMADGGAGASGRPIGIDAGPPPPAAWWRFDEGSGSTTVDASGNGHTGTLLGSPTWSSGVAGSALSFNGNSQAVIVESGPILGAKPSFTIEAWINWTGTPGIQLIYCEATSPC